MNSWDQIHFISTFYGVRRAAFVGFSLEIELDDGSVCEIRKDELVVH